MLGHSFFDSSNLSRFLCIFRGFSHEFHPSSCDSEFVFVISFVLFVVYLTTLFQYLRLYSVDVVCCPCIASTGKMREMTCCSVASCIFVNFSWFKFVAY
jgi:hypothetical protein